LTRSEMQALLAAPDRSKWSGRRDHALLLTLYNSGARVSEITDLKRDQVCFGASTFLQLHGKGRKERAVPLWPETAKVLKAWFRELGEPVDRMAFPNARGKPLSRHGVEYLLKQTVKSATRSCPSLATKTISPHVVRHYLPFLTMSGNVGKHRCKRGSGDAFTRDNLGLFRKTKNRHRIEMTRSVGPEPRESRLHLLSLLSGRRADAE